MVVILKMKEFTYGVPPEREGSAEITMEIKLDGQIIMN